MITDVAGMKQGRVRFAWDPTHAHLAGRHAARRRRPRPALVQGARSAAPRTPWAASATASACTSTWTWARRTSFRSSLTRMAAHSTPSAAQGRITRLSVDLAQAARPGYEMEVLYPHTGVLSRQDDRYHTVPYSVGLHALPRCHAAARSAPGGAPFRPFNTWTRFDHAARRDAELFRRRRRRACRNAASCRARRARPRATAI